MVVSLAVRQPLAPVVLESVDWIVVVSLAVRQPLAPVVLESVGWIGGCPRRRSPVLSPRPDLRVSDHCSRSCPVTGDFLQVRGTRLSLSRPSRCLMRRDLLVPLVQFVGGPLSWAVSRLHHPVHSWG